MKKFLSILLTACMIFSMIVIMPIVSSAEGNITSVEVTGVPELNIGDIANGIYEQLAVPEGAGYRLGTIDCYVFDYESSSFIYATGPVESGNVYSMSIRLLANEGYSFDKDVEAVIDSDNYYSVLYYHEGMIDINVFYYIDVEVIDEIVIEEFPTIEVGASADFSAIKLPEDANYTMSYTLYYMSDVAHFSFYDEESLKANSYELDITIVPEKGYWIEENAPVISPIEYSYCYSDNYGSSIYLEYEFDLRTALDSAEITVSEPVLGETPVAPQVPDGALYTAEIVWYDNATDEEVSVLEDGHDYYGYIYIIPNEGYAFTYDTELTVNGEIYTDDFDVSNMGEIDIYTETSFTTALEQIDITIPDYQPGDTVSIDDIILGDDNYYIGYYDIYCQNADDEDPSTLEDGNSYTLNIEVYGTNGYSIDENTVVYINGVEADNYYTSDFADIYMSFNFSEPLERIDITIPDYQPGDTVSIDDIILGDDNYYIGYYYFYCQNADDEDPSTLEDGNSYRLNIAVYGTNGYSVDENTVVYINGVEADIYYTYGFADIYMSFSFIKTLERIDITIPDYRPGDTVSIDDIILGDDNYYIGYYDIYCQNAYDEDPFTLEDGNSYILNIEVYGTNGYTIEGNTAVYINGVEADDYYIFDFADIYINISFATPVVSVDLPAFPEVNVGDYVFSYDIYAETDEYMILGVWATVDEEGNMVEFEGVLADKTTYVCAMLIIAGNGYELTEDTELMQNGDEYEGLATSLAGMIITFKYYPIGFETIDKIELTTDEPADGVAIGDITVADPDAKYTLMAGYWGVSEDGDFEHINDAEGVFENGNYYLASTHLIANDGYVFADDLTVTVNGKEYDIVPGYTFIFGSEARVVITLGKLGGILGDLNNDGKVNALDSAVLLKYIKAGETTAEADLNGDGKVNALDSAMLLKIIKGKYVG